MSIQNNSTTIIVSYGSGSNTFNKSLSSVAITDTDLFDTLTDFVAINAAVAGETSFTGETSTVNWWITA